MLERKARNNIRRRQQIKNVRILIKVSSYVFCLTIINIALIYRKIEYEYPAMQAEETGGGGILKSETHMQIRGSLKGSMLDNLYR